MTITNDRKKGNYLILPVLTKGLVIITCLDEEFKQRILKELGSPRGEEQYRKSIMEFTQSPEICLTDKLFELPEIWSSIPEIGDEPMYAIADHEEMSFVFQQLNIALLKCARLCIKEGQLTLSSITFDTDVNSLYGITGLPYSLRKVGIKEFGIVEYTTCEISVNELLDGNFLS